MKSVEDLMSPVNGIFSKMPDTIWGETYEGSSMDIMFFTKYAQLNLNRLATYYLDDNDIQGLADIVYEQHSRSWARVYEALFNDYNILLSAVVDETREYTREEESKGEDVIETDTTRTADSVRQLEQMLLRSGSINTDNTRAETVDLTDANNVNLSNKVTNSGSDINKVVHDITDTLDVSGTDTNSTTYGSSVSSTGSTTKSGEEKETSNDTVTKVNAVNTDGTNTTDMSVGKTGTQKDSNEEWKFGLGSTEIGTRSGRTQDERTDNLVEATTGTVNNVIDVTENGTDTTTGAKTLSFTGRRDEVTDNEVKSGTDKTTIVHGTKESRSKTGSEDTTVTHGKIEDNTQTGTETLSKSGTVNTVETQAQNFNQYTETNTDTGSVKDTDSNNEVTTGVRDNKALVTYSEKFHREADSPLQTSPELVLEEISLRKHNFMDIVIEDTRRFILGNIWLKEALDHE